MTPKIVELIESYIHEDGFTGAAVGVARQGQAVFEHYAGFAAPGLPSGPEVLFPIASITKSFTAAMLMRLVESGELTLNTYVNAVLPKFTGAGRDEVRLRHLLTHTSGLPYESDEMEARLKAQAPLNELIEEAYTAPLLFKPGTRLSYGDYNYLLAGHIAEVATGTPYAELVRALVIEPMGLLNTFVAPSPNDYGRIAKVRGVLAEDTDGAMYNSPYALSLAHPAFAVVSTLADMMRFAAHFAADGPRIHAEVTVRAMTRQQTGDVPGEHPTVKGYGAEARIPWGFGFALQTEQVPALFSELASFRTFGHGGASGCQLVADPEVNLIVVVLTNSHVRTGRDRWYRQLQSIINSAFAKFALP